MPTEHSPRSSKVQLPPNSNLTTPSRQPEKRVHSHVDLSPAQLSADSVAVLLQRMDSHAEAARNDLEASVQSAKRDHEHLLLALMDTNKAVTSLDTRVTGVVSDVRAHQVVIDSLSGVSSGLLIQKEALAALKEEQNDSNERRDRQRDIIIKGLPLTGRETTGDLRLTIISIAKAIGLILASNDLVHVFRVGDRSKNSRDPLLIVRFGSIGMRAAFFRHYMAVPDGLNATTLGYTTRARIYVSDNLTRRNSTIRQRAAVLKRDGLIGGHTVRDGLVCVTLIGETRKRVMNSIGELDRLVSGEMDIDAELDTLQTLQSVPTTHGNQ